MWVPTYMWMHNFFLPYGTYLCWAYTHRIKPRKNKDYTVLENPNGKRAEETLYSLNVMSVALFQLSRRGFVKGEGHGTSSSLPTHRSKRVLKWPP